MKKYLLFGVLAGSMFTTSLYGQTFKEKYLRDGSYIFDDSLKIRQSELFSTYKADFSLSTHDAMVQTNNVVSEEGQFTTKYELYHKGVPVEGSMMNVIGSKGIAQYANGFLRTGLVVDKDNIITEQEAIESAIEFIGANKYAWQDSALRDELIAEGDDPDARLYSQHPPLIITKLRGEDFNHSANNYHLCYKVVIHALDPGSLTNVFVNANTGVVFTSENGLEHDNTHLGNV